MKFIDSISFHSEKEKTGTGKRNDVEYRTFRSAIRFW